MESLRVLLFLLGLAALAPLPVSTNTTAIYSTTATIPSSKPVTTTATLPPQETTTATLPPQETTTATLPPQETTTATTTSEPDTTTAIYSSTTTTTTTTTSKPVTTTATLPPQETTTATTTSKPVTTTATLPPQETTTATTTSKPVTTTATLPPQDTTTATTTSEPDTTTATTTSEPDTTTATTTSEPDTTTATLPTQDTTTAPLSCPASFYAVGDRCVLVNPFIEGTWDAALYYCHTLGAELVEIETYQFFLALLSFLRDNALDGHSYWLGARDVEVEGEWRWELGRGIIPMGSPFWALDFYVGYEYNIEPMGEEVENCLRLDHIRYHYLDDDDCTNLIGFMCQLMP